MDLVCVCVCVRVQGGKEYTMRASFGLPSVESEELEGKRPITVNFEIPYFTVSGIQVSSRSVHQARDSALRKGGFAYECYALQHTNVCCMSWHLMYTRIICPT